MTKRYAQMTEKELHNHLTRKEVPFLIASVTKACVAQQRKEKHALQNTKRVHNELWRDVLLPLRYERSNVKVGAAYDTANVERVLAMQGYHAVLTELLARLGHESKQYTHTPIRLAEERNKAGKGSPITNRGAHWTDWVPTHIKLRISQLFDAIPHKTHAKRKLPFERVLPPDAFINMKTRMALRIQGDIRQAKQIHMVTPSEKTVQRLKLLRMALESLGNWPRNHALPNAWQALLPPSTGVEDET